MVQNKNALYVIYGGMTTGKTFYVKNNECIDTDNVIDIFLKKQGKDWNYWLENDEFRRANTNIIKSSITRLINDKTWRDGGHATIITNIRIPNADFKFDRSKDVLEKELVKRKQGLDDVLISKFLKFYTPMKGSILLKEGEYLSTYMNKQNFKPSYNYFIVKEILGDLGVRI